MLFIKLRDPDLDYWYDWFVVVDHAYNVMGLFDTVTRAIEYRKEMKQAGFITNSWKIMDNRSWKYLIEGTVKGDSMVKATTCEQCGFTYRFREKDTYSWCPVCGTEMENKEGC